MMVVLSISGTGVDELLARGCGHIEVSLFPQKPHSPTNHFCKYGRSSLFTDSNLEFQFFYLLKCICNSESVLMARSRSLADMHGTAKNSSCLTRALPAGLKQGATLPSRFSSHSVNKCPFHGLLSATFFTFLRSWLAMLLFKMAFRRSAETLSWAPTCEKAAMRPTEKIGVLKRLCSAMSDNVVGRELHVNESTTSIK